MKQESPEKFITSASEAAVEAMRSGSVVPAGSRQIQSVVRALDILEVLAKESDGLALSELSGRVGLNSSTCHHLISTLVARGYVLHLGRSRGYALGSKVHEMVDLALGESDPSELLKDDLRLLGSQIGHGVQLAVLAETSLLTKLRFPAPDRDAEALEPDELIKLRALHATATGKAIMAWLPEIELVRVISVNGLTRYTGKTLTTLSGLIENLRLVRRYGYSIDDEELKDGVVCIGAALRDSGGAIVGSISMTATSDKMTKEYRVEIAKKMVFAALEFSKRLRGARR
jgi:IclR family acetate operon transcriptional repressor|tara:strand:+ start:610 stop:1470 length:861 start_codon:yes stop_codon:yes gene_type:complete